jgi:hypothetical protein
MIAKTVHKLFSPIVVVVDDVDDHNIPVIIEPENNNNNNMKNAITPRVDSYLFFKISISCLNLVSSFDKEVNLSVESPALS